MKKIVGVGYLSLVLLPLLAWSTVFGAYGGGTGVEGDPYLIYDANQLNAIGATTLDWDAHFELRADIDLSDFTGTEFNIIGLDFYVNFTGVFDGNNHEISNFNYSSSGIDYVGIFGIVEGPNAQIRDLNLKDVNIVTTTGYLTGGLVARLRYGTVSGCSVIGGAVTADLISSTTAGGLVAYNEAGVVSDSYAQCVVVGQYSTGGIVGSNRGGTVIRCGANCDVYSSTTGGGGLAGANSSQHSSGPDGIIADCYAAGNVSGNSSIGGLVGTNGIASITNSYSLTNVSGSHAVGGLVGDYWEGSITNCYSTGSVHGNASVGGLVGLIRNDGEVNHCFWDIQTSGKASSAGGIGKTTAQMYQESTFTAAGWDFNTPIWKICCEGSYPKLWWEEVASSLTVSSLELDFETLEGQVSSESQSLYISNCGSGSIIEWEVIEDCNWLWVEPNSGVLGGFERTEVTIYVNTIGMSKGSYECQFSVFDPCDLGIADSNAQCSPQVVVVNLTVDPVLYVPSEYDTIQAAIDSAEDGNVVVVADGVWTGEGNRDLDFNGKTIRVSSANGPDNCIIDCQGTEVEFHRGFYFRSGEGPSAVVDGFTITGGYAWFGGGIAIEYSSPTVKNCKFVSNMTDPWGYGGGISNLYSSATVIGCIFNGNTASYGGGIDNTDSSPTIANCTFKDNLADYGGGIDNYGDSNPNIVNCILWLNSAPDGPGIYGDCAVSYSDVQGGWPGEGNIDADPCFVDAADYDFHLLSGSPGIDAGDPNSDCSNEPWPNGFRINMGAYGNTPEATRSPAGFDELAVFASYWLTDEPMVDIAPEPGGDGIANFLDFAIFADFWLWEQ